MILIIVILYLLLNRRVEGFEVDDKKMNKKALICYYGGAFREGNRFSTRSDTKYGYESQKNASITHDKLKRVLNEKGYQTDILINTRKTKYSDKLEKWYEPYNILMDEISEKIASSFGRDEMIQSTVNSINHLKKTDYDFILFIRIDLFLKPEFFEVLDTETDKISFLANNSDPIECINFTNKPNPKIVDLFILIPKKYYYILDNQFKMNHDTWSYLKKKYKLTNDDMTFMSDKMFDSNTYIDQNPYYVMGSRKENKQHHMKNDFDMNQPIKNCPKYKDSEQSYIKNPTKYYIDKYNDFYMKQK